MSISKQVSHITSHIGAIAATISMVAMPFVSLVPTTVSAASSYGPVVITSHTVTGPFAISLTGTATVASQTGANSTQHLAVDWGTGAGYDTSFAGVTFTPTFNASGFTANWSATHTYAAAGNYTIKVIVYHGNTSGQDGSDLATASIQANIPPATITVIKHVVNPVDNKTAADFTMHVSGSGIGSPSPASFAGSETGTPVSVFPGVSAGTYSVTEDAVSGYTQVSAVGCSGTIASGQSKTCTITNSGVNNAPVASNGSVSGNEDSAISGTLSATDDYNTIVSYAQVAAPQHGSLSSFNVLTGAFTYTPAANFNGADSFTFSVSDGVNISNTATESVTVNPVNDAPVAVNDAGSTAEDTVLNGSSVLANDSDVDGDTLTAVFVAGPSHGQLTLNTDGTYTYTPDANYNGADSFTYKANDVQADSNVATVSLTVSSVNDAPVAVADSFNATEDTTLTVAAAGVLSNDTDTENDALTAVLDTPTAAGSTLTLNSDGSFSYTPAANFNGVDTFTYHDVDANSAVGNSVTVSIHVAAVNDAPVAQGQSVSTNSNTAVSGVVVATDVDGDTLTYATTSNPAHGTLTVFDAAGAFTYTPDVGYVGSDSFTFKANDGTVDSADATVDITVGSVAENTSTLCSDGLDNDGDQLVDLADPDCAAFIPVVVTPPTTPTPPSGGNGPIVSGGGGNGPIVGTVLGASTGGQVLGASCGLYMNKHVRVGSKKNDTEQVKKLQALLNKYIGSNLPATGYFGNMTETAVKKFQAAHSDTILKPWNISAPTGLVYLTTLRQINLLECPALTLALPQLVEWSKNPNAQ